VTRTPRNVNRRVERTKKIAAARSAIATKKRLGGVKGGAVAAEVACD
jgi:hypothetical protein